MHYTNKTTFNWIETAEIINAYNNKTSLENIAKDYDSSVTYIKKLLIKFNVFKEASSVPKKYNVNDYYFDEINNEHKAYWFGLLCSDGYISNAQSRNGQKSVGISLSMSEYGLLEQYKQDIEFSGPVKVFKNQKTNFTEGTDYCRVLFASQHMANSLIAKGCIEHKSLTMKFPSKDIMTDDLWRHFVRGYFDGDGSLTYQSIPKEMKYKYSFTIAGTEEFLTELKIMLGKPNVKLIHDKRHLETNVWSLNLCGNRQINRILDWMYEDSTVYMPRKYKKYQEFKENVGYKYSRAE